MHTCSFVVPSIEILRNRKRGMMIRPAGVASGSNDRSHHFWCDGWRETKRPLLRACHYDGFAFPKTHYKQQFVALSLHSVSSPPFLSTLQPIFAMHLLNPIHRPQRQQCAPNMGKHLSCLTAIYMDRWGKLRFTGVQPNEPCDLYWLAGLWEGTIRHGCYWPPCGATLPEMIGPAS